MSCGRGRRRLGAGRGGASPVTAPAVRTRCRCAATVGTALRCQWMLAPPDSLFPTAPCRRKGATPHSPRPALREAQPMPQDARPSSLADDLEVEWVLARDLLGDGLHRQTGDGDVVLRPSTGAVSPEDEDAPSRRTAMNTPRPREDVDSLHIAVTTSVSLPSGSKSAGKWTSQTAPSCRPHSPLSTSAGRTPSAWTCNT